MKFIDFSFLVNVVRIMMVKSLHVEELFIIVIFISFKSFIVIVLIINAVGLFLLYLFGYHFVMILAFCMNCLVALYRIVSCFGLLFVRLMFGPNCFGCYYLL